MTDNPSKSTETQKENRLQIRIDEESYSLLEKASRYSRESLSRFVREASVRKAQQVIHQYESIHLSSQAWDTFLEALTNPPKPNEKLKRAYKRYKENT